MPVIDFLPFATDPGANVESQAAYAADPSTPIGFTTGVAVSEKLNKVWRQSAFIAAVVANAISQALTADVLDDGNLAAHVTQLNNAIKAIIATVGYAPLASPTFTGTPAAPTVAGTSDSSTKIATTAFVQAVRALLAPLASPAFTGTPTAPTVSSGTDSSTKLATTEWVTSQWANAVGATRRSWISWTWSGSAITVHSSGTMFPGGTVPTLTRNSTGDYTIHVPAGAFGSGGVYVALYAASGTDSGGIVGNCPLVTAAGDYHLVILTSEAQNSIDPTSAEISIF